MPTANRHPLSVRLLGLGRVGTDADRATTQGHPRVCGGNQVVGAVNSGFNGVLAVARNVTQACD